MKFYRTIKNKFWVKVWFSFLYLFVKGSTIFKIKKNMWRAVGSFFVVNSLFNFYATKVRSSHRRCPVRNGAPGLQLYLKRHWHRCFPVNFLKFLRTPFSQNTSKFRNIHRKTPVLESLFNKPADINLQRLYLRTSSSYSWMYK